MAGRPARVGERQRRFDESGGVHEIQDPDPPVFGMDTDAGGFKCLMDDPALVDGAQKTRQRLGDGQEATEIDLPQQFGAAQGQPVWVFHSPVSRGPILKPQTRTAAEALQALQHTSLRV